MDYDDIPAATAGEKRSRLEGGVLTEEALDSSHTVLGPTGYDASALGVQRLITSSAT